MEINFDTCSTYSGWVEKKASKIMLGWQKRYFRIFQGKAILYSEKENDPITGHINISQISKVSSLEGSQFQIILGSKIFNLRTTTTSKRDEWVKVIQFLIEYNNTQKQTSQSIDDNDNDNDNEDESTHKHYSHKVSDLDKTTLDLLRSSGIGASENEVLNEKIIKSYGIEKYININADNIKARFYCGFLYKKQKVRDNYQKRWCFLISSRPIRDKSYATDEVNLDGNKYLKDWIKFDYLFYFKYEKHKESTTGPSDGLPLMNCHKIETYEKDGKYLITIDISDRKYEFYSDIKGDRDIWFEVLKNSRRTAKEIQQSKTGNPRNIQRLQNILEVEGKNKLLKEIDNETIKNIGDYKEM